MNEIYTYLDYRTYLRDYYTYQKQKSRQFTYRYFTQLANLKTSAHYKLVMDGKRNLSANSTQQFIKGLRLNKKEARYFENLVLFNQAKSDDEKDTFFNRLMASKPSIKLQGIEKNQYAYFTQPHLVILREMMALPHFREDPKWIAENMLVPIKPDQVKESIQILLDLGLVRRNSEGKLVLLDASLATPIDVTQLEVFNFQRTMLNMAKDALLSIPQDDRNMSSVAIPMSKRHIKEIGRKIRDFQVELVSYVNNNIKDFDGVYQLNIQLFPTTRLKKSESLKK